MALTESFNFFATKNHMAAVMKFFAHGVKNVRLVYRDCACAYTPAIAKMKTGNILFILILIFFRALTTPIL
jgi:hypothetical protein